jgi:intracellular sulfur oxidation DsrE/DsrF family protein
VKRVIIVSNEYMVQPEELGAKMIGSFLRKLCQEPTKPSAIIFYGTGVNLLLDGSPVLDALEILLKQGVDLIGCGTCLGYFEVRDRIAVGRASEMKEVVSVLMKADNVVTL